MKIDFKYGYVNIIVVCLFVCLFVCGRPVQERVDRLHNLSLLYNMAMTYRSTRSYAPRKNEISFSWNFYKLFT